MSYIVPMEMPKTCELCVMYRHARCKMTGKMTEFPRSDDCPLVEIPPHGRLIDADFEEQHYTSMTTNPTPDVTEQDKRDSLVIIKALQMAKTVIPAERSGE